MQLKQLIDSIPKGFSKTVYKSQTYSLIKTTYNTGDSIKIYAEELGGTDVISANIYSLNSNYILKPCEMSKQKVLHFLNHKQDL
ncbi:peptide methionine sulfoxide reductase [Croceibacter atlanticus]|uniref:peptide methionine sulfoxide reductase n=1 Tax=Croceibacter atlanticus TaxID=313588 RepID=UPI002E118D64|nr:peptide methionine sulfoxide reductase [Croceibacter atlanticus]